mgnify:CR=1 FL=1|nr:MAG TPA: nucleoid-associated protein [Caudoviricetes sp.]
MRKIAVMDTRTIVIGRVGENEAAQVVWPGLLAKWRGLYGKGTVQLAVRRPLDKSPYPAVCEVSGDDVTWTVSAADTAQHGTGECELSYLVGDTVAKSQTWAAMILRSLTGDEPGEPAEDPAKAWFAAIQSQIGDLTDLTTKAKDNLVAAINEAAKSGSGGGGSVEMRVAGGYIQYSTDGETWENLIAVADLKGDTGPQGPKGDTGAAGQDGYSPSASVTATDDGAEITITDKTGTTKATVRNGKDAATDISLGLTAATIGQTIKVKAVDTDGKPTAWEPVDMAGGEKPITKIIDTEITEKTSKFEVNNFQGISTIVAIWSGIFNETSIDSGLDLQINDVTIASYGFIKNTKKDSKTYGYSVAKLVNGFWVCDVSLGAINKENIRLGLGFNHAYNIVEGVGTANKISFNASTTEYSPISGKLEVWVK